MEQLLAYVVILILCAALYRFTWKFFIFWIVLCSTVFYFYDPSVGVWGIVSYCIICGAGADTGLSKTHTTKKTNYPANSSQRNNIPYDKPNGSSYHPGGNVSHSSNGNTMFHSGNLTYISNDIRSVREGTITYFFDDNTGKRLGRSVDNGNGVYYYFDDDGREIGHSYTSGDITNYFGDCFEVRK